jgi:hypothetical protein
LKSDKENTGTRARTLTSALHQRRAGMSRLTSGPHYSVFPLEAQVEARNYCIDGVEMRIEGMVISANIPLDAGARS